MIDRERDGHGPRERDVFRLLIGARASIEGLRAGLQQLEDRGGWHRALIADAYCLADLSEVIAECGDLGEALRADLAEARALQAEIAALRRAVVPV